MNNHTPGPWNAGCFIDPDTTCDCKYIFSEGYHGSVAEISVDNGKRIGDGGNDSPELEEAIANARLIASAPDMYDACMVNIVLMERTLNQCVIKMEANHSADLVCCIRKTRSIIANVGGTT